MHLHVMIFLCHRDINEKMRHFSKGNYGLDSLLRRRSCIVKVIEVFLLRLYYVIVGACLNLTKIKNMKGQWIVCGFDKFISSYILRIWYPLVTSHVIAMWNKLKTSQRHAYLYWTPCWWVIVIVYQMCLWCRLLYMRRKTRI